MVLGYCSDQYVSTILHGHPACSFVFVVFLIFVRSCSPRIYRCQPWTDTAKNICSSFDQYLSDPITFFMRLPGMTLPVANFLVENVFCILDPPTDDSRRIGAREFGVWIRDLPTLMTVSLPVTRISMFPRRKWKCFPPWLPHKRITPTMRPMPADRFFIRTCGTTGGPLRPDGMVDD